MTQASTETSIPEYPFWQASDVDAVWGAGLERYVPRYQAYEIERRLRTEAEAVSSLFYQGGNLSDFGLKWRPEISEGHKPFLTLQALLCSFAPSHEAKIATAALALHHWCEPMSDDSAEAPTP